MKRAFPLLLALVLLPACSLFNAGPGESPEEIRLVNGTDEVIYYGAWELESAHLMDPLPSFDPERESPFPMLAPGAAGAVRDIAEYRPGDDVRFFLYALRRGDSVEVAALVSVVTVSAEELRQNDGRVVVDEL